MARSNWEVDWTRRSGPRQTGKVWARNTTGHLASSREWHWVTLGYLRDSGVKTPVHRKDSWEIDWDKRKGKLVWARNPLSKMPSAREWHWIDFHTVCDSGLTWKPKRDKTGRWKDGRGYIVLSPSAMTSEEVALADKYNLWKGKKRTCVAEHRLMAVKKYGGIPKGYCVRHLNGDKTDNSFSNLVLGTPKENCMDNESARKYAMFWREKCESLLAFMDEAGIDTSSFSTPSQAGP